jgi:hypothetical protein
MDLKNGGIADGSIYRRQGGLPEGEHLAYLTEKQSLMV